MKPQRLLTLVCLGFATAAPAQLRINEVLLDPVGPNAGNQIIEIINTSANPVTPPLGGWTFCIRPHYPVLPQIEIPAGGIVQVHLGAVGTNTATDWFIPLQFGQTELPLNSEFAIYSTSFFFTNPATMQDFVSWGTGLGGLNRIGTAVAALLWPNTTTHMTVPPEGSSLARFDDGTGPGSYFVDSTPTLGADNKPAAFSTFGMGCLAGPAIPAMDIVPGELPWLDENFTIEISNVPAGGLAFGVLGLSDQFFGPIPLPQDLAVIGFPGCIDYISADFITGALPEAGGTAAWTQQIPSSVPGLAGVKFFTQGVVLFGAGQGAVSNATTCIIGGVR